MYYGKFILIQILLKGVERVNKKAFLIELDNKAEQCYKKMEAVDVKNAGVKKAAPIRFILALVLIISLIGGSVPVHAANTQPIKIFINGAELSIPEKYGAPFYDGANRLQIPLRYIIEACGYDVTWNSQQKTAAISTKNGDIKITIGSNSLETSSGAVTMDTAAVINSDGRTYIPLRFALEALNFSVKWTRTSTYDQILIDGVLGDTSTTGLTAAEVSASSALAVFYIEVTQGDTITASGSGFFIDSAGTAVTNYHVIESSTSAKITMTNGEIYPVDKVLYYNVERDIAVLKVSNTSTQGTTRTMFPYLQIGNMSDVKNGESVYAIGSPLSLQNSISDGIVSNKSRTLEGSTLTYIQTTAPISEGSSGGALLNDKAEVIGVTAGSFIDGQNINLAVPINAISGISLANGVAYDQVYKDEFKKSIAQSPDIAKHILYENEGASDCFDDKSYPISSGDSFIGSFNVYKDMDFYEFYTPIPVHATVLSGGLSGDASILSSLIMTIDIEPGKTFINSNQDKDGGGNYMRVIDDALLQPGRYYINVLQSINDNRAWDGRTYYLYLSLSAA